MGNGELFDWGNRTPQQGALQRRLEELALVEQAAAWIRAKQAKGGAVGGGNSQNLAPDPSLNNYVETGYIDDYFE